MAFTQKLSFFKKANRGALVFCVAVLAIVVYLLLLGASRAQALSQQEARAREFTAQYAACAALPGAVTTQEQLSAYMEQCESELSPYLASSSFVRRGIFTALQNDLQAQLNDQSIKINSLQKEYLELSKVIYTRQYVEMYLLYRTSVQMPAGSSTSESSDRFIFIQENGQWVITYCSIFTGGYSSGRNEPQKPY